jgi:cytochrome c
MGTTMDSFEAAKIAGGVLSALLVIVGFRTALEIAEMGHGQAKPGYTLPMPAEPSPSDVPAEGAPGVAAPVDLPAIPAQFNAEEVAQASASANPEAGATIFKKCQACHSSEQGGPNKVGPNLWGVVGRPKASHEGFNYSAAMQAKGGDWTLPDLAAFVHKPKDFVPGTKMVFPGIADSTDMADLLAYLNTLK